MLNLLDFGFDERFDRGMGTLRWIARDGCRRTELCSNASDKSRGSSGSFLRFASAAASAASTGHSSGSSVRKCCAVPSVQTPNASPTLYPVECPQCKVFFGTKMPQPGTWTTGGTQNWLSTQRWMSLCSWTGSCKLSRCSKNRWHWWYFGCCFSSGSTYSCIFRVYFAWQVYHSFGDPTCSTETLGTSTRSMCQLNELCCRQKYKSEKPYPGKSDVGLCAMKIFWLTLFILHHLGLVPLDGIVAQFSSNASFQVTSAV